MGSIETSDGETITFDASVTPRPPKFRQEGENDIEATLAFTPTSPLSVMSKVSEIVDSIGDLRLTAPTTNPAWPEGFGKLDISELLPTIDPTELPTVAKEDFTVPAKPDIDLPTEAELEEQEGQYLVWLEQ